MLTFAGHALPSVFSLEDKSFRPIRQVTEHLAFAVNESAPPHPQKAAQKRTLRSLLPSPSRSPIFPSQAPTSARNRAEPPLMLAGIAFEKRAKPGAAIPRGVGRFGPIGKKETGHVEREKQGWQGSQEAQEGSAEGACHREFQCGQGRHGDCREKGQVSRAWGALAASHTVQRAQAARRRTLPSVTLAQILCRVCRPAHHWFKRWAAWGVQNPHTPQNSLKG